MLRAWLLRDLLSSGDFPASKQETLMFRRQFAARAATLCGLLAAVVYFFLGLSLTIGFSRWDPYMRINWQNYLDSVRTSFGADFLTHSFLAFVALGTLLFFLALGARLYPVHPTSTVSGLVFLSIPVVLLAIYNVWLAFGHDLVLLRYRSTSDEALRQTFEHLYQAGFLGTPVLSAVMAYFAIAGFLLLGFAFVGRPTGRALSLWSWLSAAGLVFAVLALGYGYDRTFGANQMPRTLMTWGHLGLWVLPSVTLGLCASWLWQNRTAEAERAEPQPTQPPLPKAA
jgi:hypothetical protein